MSIADRTYARVETNLKGYLRIMSPEQTRPLYSGESGTPVPSEYSQSGLSEPIVHFMRDMDAKLNSILGLLTQQFLREDFETSVRIHDLSGAGLRFSSHEQFEIGTAVEIVVALFSYPLRLAGTQGIIIRKDYEANQTLWALEFTDMREAERDKIIQFVISEQREQLRDRRIPI